MSNLILVRHGQSEWNLENLFTGWVDCELTQNGIEEAKAAGKDLKVYLENNALNIDSVHTSVLKRAIDTASIILEESGYYWKSVNRSWRLNERHYGNLQGKNKAQIAEEFGDEQVKIWRRSYDIAPPEFVGIDESIADLRYKDIPKNEIPKSESLKDVVVRVLPYYIDDIFPLINSGKTVLVIAHGNSIRALVKYLSGMDSKEIINFELPTGKPLVYNFNSEMEVKDRYFL